MLESIYHMTLKLLKNRIFSLKKIRLCNYARNVDIDVITLQNKYTTWGLDLITLRNITKTQRHEILSYSDSDWCIN